MLPAWREADLRLGNLESPVTSAARAAPCKLTLRAAPDAVASLWAAAGNGRRSAWPSAFRITTSGRGLRCVAPARIERQAAWGPLLRRLEMRLFDRGLLPFAVEGD